ncbi:copper radical oxidase [Exidia glandulosa HHB12029]|uniref:Copper radical oxidase n=1 Tax=Exidia glandulosa HHB12029 TaxID=1314781 RepID=A0A165Q755_EXIGL|nr:copper radical oxidase [Exidia glandulosa HHB12029]
MKAFIPVALSLTTFVSSTTANSLEIHDFPIRRSRQHADLARAHHKRQVTARPLPEGWTSQGCFLDNVGGRTFTADSFVDDGMTQEACANFCNDKHFAFAGVEFGRECYCDNFVENGGAPADDASTCNMACGGNSTELCGGPNRLNVFFSNVPPPPRPPPPAELPSHGLWESIGCFSEGNGGRTLPVVPNVPGGGDNMTVENCLDSCLAIGFGLAGTEFGAECYCGLQFGLDGAPADDGCTMACKGDGTELCGGPNRLNAYNFTGTVPTPPQLPPNGGGGQPAGPPAVPQTTDLVDGWQFIGCYSEGVGARAMSVQRDDNSSLVPNDCLQFCADGDFTIAGMEFGVQCFCDTILREAAAPVPETDCSMGCGGNSTIACGAGNRLSIYATTPTVDVLPIPTPKTTGLVTDWEFQGCFKEPDFPAPRVFPYKTVNETGQDVNTCLALCEKFGFPAAGIEFGNECWCGDVADMDASPGLADITDCSFPCPAAPTELCGAGNRLQTYFFKGPDLFNWHTPEVTGRYEFLVGGPVVPLVTALGKNNKVTFLEKLGSGPQNSTHAYELDYTLAVDAEKAFREMHVKTDVFCAAGVVLPDKAARQLSVGGWSLDSTFGIRLYSPDGELGTNSTNDWEENFEEIQLQSGRWYPSAMVMTNGSILVVGGERGANDIPVPTIEILPRIPGGPTLLELEFLRELDPNDLYPFLFVLPGGGIYFLGFNQARVLNAETFDTEIIFPTIPGSVNEVAGRTYPMQGASVMLPMHAPYTEPAQILTCGGSPGGGAMALDNCVLISPEVPGADWQIERMPFRRVMPCMTALPDGTYLIVNGAEKGVAGFGLANDPTLTALLYDPTLAVGSRFSILNTTIVGRMYHSESILLHDGRVLISGSDPLTTVLNDDGTINEDLSYPEEYRVEVYVPPYLTTGRTQPTFSITNTDWEYGKQYSIVVQLAHGTTSTMRVSILGAVVSTHGNNFGQRTLFPEFSCTGNTCKVTAPPNANIFPPGWAQLFVLDGPTPSFSTWVRIGGDPASIGDWPAGLDDFHPPGV